MKVKVVLGREERVVEVAEGATVAEVLRALGVNREEVVVRLRDAIVTEEEALRDGDTIELIRVISGG
ncbi:MAG: MoaD/ThiS family protein [Euryarchaeota archaeon]|nr:MoaD/ThiS family protein [Euryarchaeota archaeon]